MSTLATAHQMKRTEGRKMRLGDCLIEMTKRVGPAWEQFPLLGATRAGLAPAKEAIGKAPERYKPVEPGTIFYNPMRILLGSIAMVDDGERAGITSPDYVVLRTRPGVLHHRFFYYWLRSAWGEQLILSLARGAVRERILFKRLAEGEIDLPPWSVQERVAEALTVVPTLRRAAQARLAAAEALPAAYLREVFEGADVEKWRERTLSDLLQRPIRTGISKRGRPDSANLCLTLSSVRGRTLRLDACKGVDIEDDEANGSWVEPGCFYVVRGNGNRELVGRGSFAPSILRERILFPDLLFRVDLNAEVIDPDFFWCLWSSARVRQCIEGRARTAAGIYKINTANLNSLPLRLPDPPQQREVARRVLPQLESAEAIAARCREELDAIDSLPAAYLRQAFEGLN